MPTSFTATATTFQYWTEPESTSAYQQTSILDSAVSSELDSILYFPPSEQGTPLFGAVGGWFTAYGLLPQWVSSQPEEMISYWGGDLASSQSWTEFPVTVDVDSVRNLFGSDYTQVLPGTNVMEVFGPSITMTVNVTGRAAARLIVLNESVRRKARRVFSVPADDSALRTPDAGGTPSAFGRSALDAVNALSQWLLISPDDVAELCRFNPRNLTKWRSGTTPHATTVRRLMEVNALVSSLRTRLGSEAALFWLNAPSSGGSRRIDVLATESGPQDLINEAASLLFAAPTLPKIRPEYEDEELLLAESDPPTVSAHLPPRRIRRPPRRTSTD